MNESTVISIAIVALIILFAWVLIVLVGVVIDALQERKEAKRYTFDNSNNRVDEIIKGDKS